MIMGRVTHHLPEFSFILFFMSHAQSNSMATALVDVVGEMYSTLNLKIYSIVFQTKARYDSLKEETVSNHDVSIYPRPVSAWFSATAVYVTVNLFHSCTSRAH